MVSEKVIIMADYFMDREYALCATDGSIGTDASLLDYFSEIAADLGRYLAFPGIMSYTHGRKKDQHKARSKDDWPYDKPKRHHT